jgi:hypothetical protein
VEIKRSGVAENCEGRQVKVKGQLRPHSAVQIDFGLSKQKQYKKKTIMMMEKKTKKMKQKKGFEIVCIKLSNFLFTEAK